LELSGTTGWLTYPIENDEEILQSELIVTIETDRNWLDEDAPVWFVAIPSDADDPEGVRDYIVIKGRYLRELDDQTGRVNQR